MLFRRTLQKGFARNVEMDPIPSAEFAANLEAGENVVVAVTGSKGQNYWFTATRVVRQQEDVAREQFRYDEVQAAHWMFKDYWNRLKRAQSMAETTEMKTSYFDRIEIETPRGIVVLEGLQQAYSPTLQFLRSVST